MATQTDSNIISSPGEVRFRPKSRLKEHRWIIPTLRAASDALLVFVAFAIAYWLRYNQEIGGDVLPGFSQPFGFFAGKVLILMAATVIIFQLRGLYRLPRWTSFLDEASIIASGATTSMAIIILYSFLQRFYPSRLIFIYAWLLMIALLLAKRVVSRSGRSLLWSRGIGVDRVLVVGAGPASERYMQHVLNYPQAGYRLVGFVDDGPVLEDWGIATERRVVRPAHLGPLQRIPEVIQARHIDEVVIALPPTAHEEVMRIIEQCRVENVAFTLVPDLFELTLDQVITYDLGGLPLIGLKESRIQGWNYAVKRAMDIVIALTVLTAASPFMVLAAIAIKLDSKGPVLFTQERIGRNGHPFTLYKFRTMRENAADEKSKLQEEFQVGDLLFKLQDDPRRTRVGRFLRRTSFDEVPQFFNILLGEMSVVGPRPQVPEEVANYEDWHCRRLEVTPGLTGLWQVNGRSDLSFNEMVKLDLYYLEHWSPWLDIKLMLRTVPAVILARGAY